MSVSRITTWTSSQVLTAAALNGEFDQMATNIPAIASQTDMDTGTNTTKAVAPYLNRISLGTEAATTSGTTVLFSSIPSGTRRITINPVGMSTGGTSDITVTLGDAGGLETSGYSGSVASLVGTSPTSSTFANAFVVTDVITATSTLSGTITLTLEDPLGFTWNLASILASGNTAAVHFAAGSKSLSAELTQVQISSVSGDTFDAGAINITYER